MRLNVWSKYDIQATLLLWKGFELTGQICQTDLNSVDWSEMRTAYMVGELHTLSRTAQHLGVHRSTVMRQITSLECRIGRRIFQREHDGYYPTKFGFELISVARQAALDFREFFLTRGSAERTITGNIMIAAPSCLTRLITTVLADLRTHYPDLWYSYSSIEEDAEFEMVGEPDIVLAPPTHLARGYSAQKLTAIKASLFASDGYVQTHGIPKTVKELRDHTYISGCSETFRDSAETWLREHTSARSIIFRANGFFALYSAIASGIGIGFLPTQVGLGDPGMIQIKQPSANFSKEVWVFTRNEHAKGRRAQIFLEALRKHL